MFSAQKIKYKEKMTPRRLLFQHRIQDNKMIQIPLLVDLLLFANHISNRASTLLPSYKLLVLPILKILYRILYKLKRSSSPKLSSKYTLLLLSIQSDRYFMVDNLQIL